MNKTKNKAVVVEWFDDENPDSYVLCLEPYGLKCLRAEPIDSDNTEVVLYGSTEDVDKFLEDLDEDDLQPFSEVQSGAYDDDDYVAWLSNEVNRYFAIQELDVFKNCY